MDAHEPLELSANEAAFFLSISEVAHIGKVWLIYYFNILVLEMPFVMATA